jgi:hypothetical protein
MKNTKLRLAGLLGFIILLPCFTLSSREANNPDGTTHSYVPVTILYRVQILALKNPITLNSVTVNGVEGDVYSMEGNGYTRYFMGEFNDLKSALDFRTQLVKNGFEDACVVAYKNGDRITIKESLAILGEGK